MKKLSKVFAFITLCVMLTFQLISCSSGEIQRMNDPVTDQPTIQYNEIIAPKDGIFVGKDRGDVNKVKIFTFRGHRYIQFKICGTFGGSSGIVHDPDCLREDLERWK
jgi:hypothetical protein